MMKRFYSISMFQLFLLQAIIILSFCSHKISSINSSPFGFREKQPTGILTPELFIHQVYYNGDRIIITTDLKGYPVIKENNDVDSKWLVYGKLKKMYDYNVGGERIQIIPTSLRVGRNSPNKIQSMKTIYELDFDFHEVSSNTTHTTTWTGTKSNLVVLVRFLNHDDRILPSVSDLNILYNNQLGSSSRGESLKEIFFKNSHNSLHVNSTIYNNVIELPETEEYYASQNYGFNSTRENELLLHVLGILESDSSFSFLEYDLDSDQVLDALTILHSGYGAEWGRTDCSELKQPSFNRIWSHTSTTDNLWTSTNDDIQVNKVSIISSFYGTSCEFQEHDENVRVGVLSHEMAHLLGIPYPSKSSFGSYCMMSNPWGFDGSQLYPPLINPWSRMKTNWISTGNGVQTIPYDGTYTIHSIHKNISSQSAQIYKVEILDEFKVEEESDENEYILIENRQPRAPHSHGGLAIWYVYNKTYSSSPPPITTVELLQADGTNNLKKGKNRGDSYELYSFGGTDTFYNEGFEIFDISQANETMTFKVNFISTAAPTIQPTSSPTAYESQINEITTTFDYNSGQDGNMFDVIMKEKDIVVHELHLHCKTKKHETLEIWMKNGTYQGYEQNNTAWTNLYNGTTIRCKGGGKPTIFEHAILMERGKTYGYYITSSTIDPKILYTTGTQIGRTFVSNEHMDITEGTGNMYPFGFSFGPRVWNGSFRYRTLLDHDLDNHQVSEIVSLPPTPTPVYSLLPDIGYNITTTLAGGNSQNGNMFDIVALSDIIIESFDIHTAFSSESEMIKIWTKEGSYRDSELNERNEWTLICTVFVTGQGEGNFTKINSKRISNVKINAGSTQAFYITTTGSDSGAHLKYTTGSTKKEGDHVVSSNEHLQILEGIGIKYPFSHHIHRNRIWNGRVHYALQPYIDPTNHYHAGLSPVGSYPHPATYFDIIPQKDLYITTWYVNVPNEGKWQNIDLYYREGSFRHHGALYNASAWTYLGTGRAKSRGSGENTNITGLPFDGLAVKGGQRYSFSIQSTKGINCRLTSAHLRGTYIKNRHIKLFTGGCTDKTGFRRGEDKREVTYSGEGGIFYSVLQDEYTEPHNFAEYNPNQW